MRDVARLAVLAWGPLIVGCGSTQNEGAPQPVADAGPPDVEAPAPLAFTACPPGYTGECAIVDAPLDHDAPNGKKVKLLISRIISKPNAPAQLWLLQGGPGSSAADLTQTAEVFGRGLPKLDVYTLEHRGVGASDRLACASDFDTSIDTDEKAVAAAKACIAELEAKWGKDGLAKFNITQAARDLGWAIDRARQPGQKVFVYGVSAGTAWAMRYLQVRGEQPDAVILDSIVTPGVQLISHAEGHLEQAVIKLADVCKNDATCRAHMGDDPLAKTKALVADVKAGKCAAAETADQVFADARSLMSAGNVFVFPLLYRYGRCAAGDVAAIQFLHSKLRATTPAGRSSPSVRRNINFSEHWEVPAPSIDVMKARSESALIPGSLWHAALIQEIWPKYPRDEYWGQLPTTSKPVLLMNGTLDPLTPIELAEKSKPAFMGAGQSFVTIPWANHQALLASAAVGGGGPCGQQVAISFLSTGTPDTSCVRSISPPSFTPNTATVSFFFGRDDAWDDPP